MEVFVGFVLTTLSWLLAIPVAILFVEVIAAITLPPWIKSEHWNKKDYGQVAVLVPAHNESSGILPTVEDVKSQLRADDRLVVVADNCSDDTAAVAAGAGVEVVKRHDTERIGKGYALDWGLRYLSQAPPQIVIVIDADCRLAAGALERLATTCTLTSRPVQAFYKITSPEQSALDHRFAEFTSRVKNWVRPLGMRALRLPCQLLGTGMAFSWESICAVELAHSGIVEDVKLGLDLAAAGYPPIFCPSAVVSSWFPASISGTESQRQRWEHGHLGMIVRTVPQSIYSAVTRGNWGLLSLTLDIAIPPLLLLGVLVFMAFLVSGLAALLGLSSSALSVSGACALAYGTAVFLCWMVYGREVLPIRAISSFGPFAMAKYRLYCRLLSRGAVSVWIRTDRKKSDDTTPNNVA